VAVVTPAEPHHIGAFAVLLEEMDRFYGATVIEPLQQRLVQIRETLFSKTPAACALLAWQDAQLAGFASYSYLWPAVGLTRSLYLKELYVAESHRRSGIGTQLMNELVGIATEKACSRIEWTTDTDNTGAQRFYERIARPHPSKLFYRVADIDPIRPGHRRERTSDTDRP
jgi:ribosomal protein S18 acetylase RimI-like enzyme